MKASSVQAKVLAILSCFALVFFLEAPSLQAQDQAAPPAQPQAGENISNMPAVDDNLAADDSHDAPSRVARISFFDGSVSIQPGGNGDWGNVTRNRPVTIGDKLWSDKDSRLELQAGQVSFHLGGMTAVSFLNLDENITQLRLAEGKVNFRVREIRQGETYEVDTPNLTFTVKEAGAFRIDVNENGDFTSVTVIRGAGEVASGGQAYPVKASERVDVTGTDTNVKVSSGPGAALDPLDQWAQKRDSGEDNSVSAKYVNRDVVGYSDLDDNGTWREDPTYGNVWTPNDVGPDWAPYSDGNWDYVAPWGWTWVGYEPWGFAPYHYGRWHHFGSYWGWAPGPFYARPFYGPAFVGFLGGFGFGFGLGFGGGFGWFPLGWGEPFHPWYPYGRGYFHGINVHNTSFRSFNAAAAHSFSNYAYAHDTHAVTVASHSAFVNGQAINRSSQHLTAASLRGAQVTSGVHAEPTRSSSLGAANMNGHVATPSASVQNRSVMARSTPAAAASHSPASTMNSAALSAGRGSSSTVAHAMSNGSQSINTSRQSQLSATRPSNTSQAGASTGRSWSAQGNTTDSGRAPQGFGGSNRPSTSMGAASNNSANRPPWAGSGAGAPQRNSVNRPSSSYNGSRSYSPPSYNGSRGYSAPRSNSSAPRSSGGGSSSHGGSVGGSHGGGGGGGSHGGGGGHH